MVIIIVIIIIIIIILIREIHNTGNNIDNSKLSLQQQKDNKVYYTTHEKGEENQN